MPFADTACTGSRESGALLMYTVDQNIACASHYAAVVLQESHRDYYLNMTWSY